MQTIDRSQARYATRYSRRSLARLGRSCREERDRARLSDDRRDLAAAAWPGVAKVAAAFARNFPRLRQEFYSDAALRLLDAARGYDPEKTPDFGLYARHVVRLAMVTTLRKSGEWSRSRPISGHDDLASQEYRCPVEEADAFDRLVRVVPGRGGEALALIFRDGLTHEEAGARLGVTGRTIDKDLALALARLRERIKQ
jgi:RNA polymerase sigma factor (sigma-70 family)